MIEIAFMVYAFAAPVAVFLAYRRGMIDGKTIDEGNDILPIVPKKAKKKQESEDERKLRTLLNNIDVYDGTNKGQKEVK
jgi:hypothetical protein